MITRTQNIDKVCLIRTTDDAAIENIPHVHWTPTDKNTGYWSDHSAIPVKVARSLFRTYGFDEPSDVDIEKLAEDVDDADADDYVPAKLRSLYNEPVLMILGDADKDKFVAYYADRGINSIKAYPETFDVMKNMLGASNVVSLNFRPEKMFLYPEDRYAVSNRFFAPKNLRIVPLTAEFDRAADSYRVHEAPVVLRKYEIPYYPGGRTPYVDFDIEKVPFSHRYPVTLKMSESLDYPLWKKQTTPYYMYPSYTEFTPNAYKTLHGKYVYDTTDLIPDSYLSNLPAKFNRLDVSAWRNYCTKNPEVCYKRIKINAENVKIPHKTIPFDYPIHIANEDTLKAANFENYMDSDDAVNMCVKNPLACGTYMKSTTVPPYWNSLSNVPLTVDYMHDTAFHMDKTGINKPHKVIVPSVHKNNVPDYLENYNPGVVHPATGGHDIILKSILGSQ